MERKIPRIGVIGGSGLYEMPGAKVLEEVSPATPFGPPSDARFLLKKWTPPK